MTRLDWASAPRFYEAGVSNGVLYSDGIAIPWNGLIAVDEAASETQSDAYFDGNRVVINQDVGDFEASLQAFTYPDELEEPEGYSEDRRLKRYGLSYRTQSNHGDKIHIVYNALIRQSDRSWTTTGDRVNPSFFRWDIRAAAVNIPGARPASHLVIDTTATDPALISVVEGWLYGTEDTEPRLPDAEAFIDIFEAVTTLKITQNGDGTWTATGPDHIVRLQEDGSFDISAPTAFFLDPGTFTVASY